MSSGGSKQTGQTTTSTDLMPSVKGGIDKALGGAQGLYDSGNLFKTYPYSTVVPFSGETEQGMQGTMSASQQWLPKLNDAANSTSALANSQTGLNNGQQQSLNWMSGVANGTNAINTGDQFQSIYDDASGSNAQNLAAFARGDYLDGSNNPHFSKVVDRAAEGARDAVNMNFSGAGRYGSGANQQIVAREVGDLTNRAYADQYNNEVANMFGANAQMDQQRLANLGVRGTAAQGLTGVQNQNITNQMQARGDMFNAYQQGVSNQMNARSALGAQQQAAMMPYQQMMGIGSMREDETTRTINDAMRRWQGDNDQARLSTEWLAGLSSGAGGMGSTQTQTAYAPKTSPFMTAAGGAATGFGIGGPVGGLVGGGLGLLGGLF